MKEAKLVLFHVEQETHNRVAKMAKNSHRTQEEQYRIIVTEYLKSLEDK
jgi:hypothetical protein